MPYPWPIPDVVGVELYKQDAVVLRRGYSRPGVDWQREDVKQFSWASRKRLAFVAANTDVIFTSMMTLTYPRVFPNDGKDVKRNLNAFLVALRRRTEDVKYLWFLEFQKRGAPHIHIVVRGVRVNRDAQHWVSKTWYRLCATNDPRHLAAGTRLERVRSPNGARNYCVKYAYKMHQKNVPALYRNVGRFWGCSRSVKPVCRSSHKCTQDDIVGALQATGWAWQRSERIEYSTLYGAAECLTTWLSDDILVLSTSGQDQTGGRPPEPGCSHNTEEVERWAQNFR